MYTQCNQSKHPSNYPLPIFSSDQNTHSFIPLHTGLFQCTLDETEWGLYFPYFHPFVSTNKLYFGSDMSRHEIIS